MKNTYKAFICILAFTLMAPTAEAYVYGYRPTYQYRYQSYNYRDFSMRPNYTNTYASYTNTYAGYPTYANYGNYQGGYISYANSAPTYYYNYYR